VSATASRTVLMLSAQAHGMHFALTIIELTRR
jgi:hypothetical protein